MIAVAGLAQAEPSRLNWHKLVPIVTIQRIHLLSHYGVCSYSNAHIGPICSHSPCENAWY